jgi:hypothetical protein
MSSEKDGGKKAKDVSKTPALPLSARGKTCFNTAAVEKTYTL